MYFGSGTNVFGPVQSNKGIHFDGFAQNLVSSAVATYVDPDCTGTTAQCTEYGVYTDVGNAAYPSAGDPQPPTAVPNRTDIFAAGRQFPVPAFDFTGLTAGLTQLQTLARSGGKEWAASGSQGYHMVFRVTGNSTVYDMYKVTALQPQTGSCGTDRDGAQPVAVGNLEHQNTDACRWRALDCPSERRHLRGRQPVGRWHRQECSSHHSCRHHRSHQQLSGHHSEYQSQVHLHRRHRRARPHRPGQPQFGPVQR